MFKNINTLLEKLNAKRRGQMTSQSSIMDKRGTLPNETIHITPKCIVHLHGHWNKMVYLMKPSVLAVLTMSLRFETTLVDRLMTFETTISRVRFITTTSSIKTQSFKVM
jgi:hypothetical protein